MRQIQAAIKAICMTGTYKGKTVRLRINLAPDGTLKVSLKVAIRRSVSNCCGKNGEIPKPPSQAVYESSKMRHWTSNLSDFPRANGKTN
jgi:membrane protein involved in colicin uptake